MSRAVGSMTARGSLIIASADRRLARLGVYRSDSRPLVKLQSLLAAVAIVTVALLILDGAVLAWHNGSGSGSGGVEVLWRVCGCSIRSQRSS